MYCNLKQILSLIILLGGISSCTQTPLEEALQAAGDNRGELEFVLHHYRNDSLKLRAAEFLIENMPYHYGYEGKELEKYYRYFERFSMSWRGPTHVRDSLIAADGYFLFDSLKVAEDITHVDAVYLIRNIDFAFKVWQEQPWGKHIKFEDFLEYILPYRIGTEQLIEWREEIYNRYNPMLDSIRATPDADNIRAVTEVLMDSLSKDPVHFTGIFPNGPSVGPKLVKWRSGNCRELTDLVIYVFRALGIPGGCDKMLLRGDKNVAHFWNFIIDENDTTFMANMGDQMQNTERADTYWDPKGKVYRETFSVNHALRDGAGRDVKDIPGVFQVPLMKDVTPIYAGKINWQIKVPLDSLDVTPRKHEPIFLCMASYLNWMPVAYGRLDNDTIRIDNVQGAVVFKLAVCRGGQMVYLCSPFLLEKYTGRERFFHVQEQRENIVLFQKFKEDFQAHMIDGVFEASNNKEFKTKDTLYKIPDRPSRLMNVIHLNGDRAYRYYRYYGPENRHCNIAELSFYATNDSEEDGGSLKGEIIFNPSLKEGFYANQFSRVFDGDAYTSLDCSLPSGGWVGLDFGKPIHVKRLVFTPRNRDNFIRKGDHYELFYADAEGWQSLGSQIATSDSLVYQVPKGALLYLKNRTRGCDERIFEMVDGKQKLW